MSPFTTSLSRQTQGTTHVRRVFDLPLESGLTAPAVARHQARTVLASWGLSEDEIYDTLLVISELVTNAITHALPPVTLHLYATGKPCGRVQVRVSDGGPQAASETWAACRPEDEHGRGNAIITALANEIGADADPAGLIDRWADLSAARQRVRLTQRLRLILGSGHRVSCGE